MYSDNRSWKSSTGLNARLRSTLAWGAALTALAGVACSSAPETSEPAGTGGPPSVPSRTATAVVTPEPEPAAAGGADDAGQPQAVADSRTLSPILQELNPSGPKKVDARRYRQLLPRDGIKPVYDPIIGTPDEVKLAGDELVIGLSIGGVSRAYPIRPLRFREMVNDELDGIPILVTW